MTVISPQTLALSRFLKKADGYYYQPVLELGLLLGHGDPLRMFGKIDHNGTLYVVPDEVVHMSIGMLHAASHYVDSERIDQSYSTPATRSMAASDRMEQTGWETGEIRMRARACRVTYDPDDRSVDHLTVWTARYWGPPFKNGWSLTPGFMQDKMIVTCRRCIGYWRDQLTTERRQFLQTLWDQVEERHSILVRSIFGKWERS